MKPVTAWAMVIYNGLCHDTQMFHVYKEKEKAEKLSKSETKRLSGLVNPPIYKVIEVRITEVR